MKTKGNCALPSRTFYIEGESLFSYLLRTAENNGVTLILLMNMIRKNEKYLLHAGDIRRIDYYPESVFNIEKLSKLTGISQSDVNKGSFTNVVNTFGYSTNGEQARFTNDMIRATLHFCPQCLKENRGYDLLWKVEGIDSCQKHNQRLVNKCSYCNHRINYNEITSLRRCPHCDQLLTDIPAEPTHEGNSIARQKSVRTNMNQLIYGDKLHFEVQSLAQKLLFLLNDSQSMYHPEIVKKSLDGYTLAHLLQYARNTIKAKKILKLNFVFNVLYKNKVCINDLYKMKIPPEFLESLLKDTSTQWTRGHMCIAPWCKQKDQPGSLVSTNTKHTHKSGKGLSHYLICKECFCEYAFNQEKKLIERTSFIAVYDVLTKRDISNMSWLDKKKCFFMNKERIRRGVAYFNVRQILLEKTAKAQYEVNELLLEMFISALKQGQDIAQIRFWPKWNGYGQYLLHRYHPAVMRELFNRRYNKEKMIFSDHTFEHEVQFICEQLIVLDISITLPNVSKELGISTSTLYKRGGARVVHNHKEIQLKRRREHLFLNISKKAISYIGECSEHVYSQKLYAFLGIRHGYLKKVIPELVEQIEEWREERNSEIQRSGDLVFSINIPDY
ncbi:MULTISPECIES: TniQ family protein [unclassified Paenibacillus]|uniref:TniQ family protein n=1 Tax=unclassified Paenibacillus TaxID=185978 RepID=UPI001AE20A7F|nr:TniQ family protein [Paenibacillus sp. PvR133]MBP1172883.1 hypothetical protein [Paenibacillus sp. PvR133]